MSKITGNEPITPLQFEGHPSYEIGLTIRQQFAAMAMQGILSSWDTQSFPTPGSIQDVVKKAVFTADALIIELNK